MTIKKAALITGGSGDIGRAIVKQLSEDTSLHILIHCHQNKNEAHQLCEELNQKGVSCEVLVFNLLDSAEINNALAPWISDHFGNSIEVLVNNAGKVNDELMVFMQEEHWDQILGIKLDGFFKVTRPILPGMAMRRRGRIINIASIAAEIGVAGQVHYAAANGGLISATKSLAKEVASRNITVNAILPGYIEGKMVGPELAEKVKKNIPAGRLGTPAEIAHLVSFLASDKASYINGAAIQIDGGL